MTALFHAPAAFEDIRRAVEGASVLLLGSAPGAHLAQRLPEDHLLVCVNAAALGLAGRRTPDVLLFNSAVAAAHNAGQPTCARLGELDARLLVVVESSVPLSAAEPVLRPIRRDRTAGITLDERCRFLEEYLERPLSGRVGGEHVPSTGFFACLALLACGARRVRPLGFSFDGGHSYLRKVYQREHVARDREVLEWLRARSAPVDFPPELVAPRPGGLRRLARLRGLLRRRG